MAKKDLLYLTQKVLSAIDGDSVTDIYATEESEQVADIIIDTYEYMISNNPLEELESLVKFDSLSDNTKPNYLLKPENVDKVKTVRYRHVREDGYDEGYVELQYMSPKAFLDHISQRSLNNDDVIEVVDHSGVSLPIDKTLNPTYFTSFDDTHIVTDSYLSTVDTVLQASKTLAYGTLERTLHKENNAVPFLDSNQFSLLLEDAKSTAKLQLREMADPKAEQRVRKQTIKQNKYSSNFEVDGAYPVIGR